MNTLTKLIKKLKKLITDYSYDPIIEIPPSNDLREIYDERGRIIECSLCKIPLIIDGDEPDYSTDPYKEVFCINCQVIHDEDYIDYREDVTQRGNITECYYCGTNLLIDGDNNPLNDYSTYEPETHCEDCMSAAIRNLT